MEQQRKHSKKREAILAVLRSTKCHPTAEWVLAQLKPQYPDLSLGTVYRNLALFREEGTIMSVGTVDGQERYDGNPKSHPHFVCTHCHRVEDLDDPALSIEDSYKAVEIATGCSVESSRVTFFGQCADCRQAQIDNI